MLRKKRSHEKLHLLKLIFTLVLDDSFNIENVSKIKNQPGVFEIY